jgi:hypothetical protein
MPIYETNCNLCSQKTLHSAADEAGAGEKHRALDSHKEAQAQFDAISEKYNKLRAADAENFKHGKDHND